MVRLASLLLSALTFSLAQAQNALPFGNWINKPDLLRIIENQVASRPDQLRILKNQVGYYPDQEKYIVLEGEPLPWYVKVPDNYMFPDSKVKWPKDKTLPLRNVRPIASPLSGKMRYIAILDNATTPGRYQLVYGDQTTDILVSERPYRDIAKASLRLFYLIRSGVPIERGGAYNRPLGHPDTQVLVHPSAATEKRPAGTVISSPYGWYDAGDYNKYVVNSAFSIGLMFAAYEQLTDYFATLDTDIPESGNQTPDFLDEMMFNLHWLLTMQDPDDGGVYHKLTTPNFEAFIMPTECKQQRYVVAKSITATLDFAAVMADAARLFAPYQRDYPGFVAQAEKAAKQAYQWAKDHPQAMYNQNQLRDPAVTTGTYSDFNARDEFFWAASALYRLTKESSYLTDVRQYEPRQFSTPSWGNVSALGAFEWLAEPLVGNVQSNDEMIITLSDEFHVRMLNQLTAYCDASIKGVDESSFQSPYGNSAGDFGWGCLAEKCCCQGFALLYADKMLGTDKYRQYALMNADYLLGRNATGYCYVTGFGELSPMHPHHRISSADGVEAPFPGMLVGGPNHGQQDKRDLKKAVYPSNVPDESYIDDEDSYASNEIAINWNASLVAFLSWLDALALPDNPVTLKSDDVTMVVDVQQGGKVLSLRYADHEVISQLQRPEWFGSTFWTSPQREWNWPPVQEFDKRPYAVDHYDANHLAITSPVSQRLGLRVSKDFRAEKDGTFLVTYSIKNEGTAARRVAPWEITRVINDDGIIFFDAPVDSIWPADLMTFTNTYGASWYKTDEAPQNRKVNANAAGWLAYSADGFLLLKQFQNLRPGEAAPGEAEVQVYVNAGKTYIELESQGAYTLLQPGESLQWAVRWHLAATGDAPLPSKALMKRVKKLIR
ncbi:MAG: glycoside hydrolase family 9 protein [Bacteroidaceae bacterium]|nr:glycoside hydrolase family 9 protein [Bacteroidaceae bacterium]